jgi:hypothetical protein
MAGVTDTEKWGRIIRRAGIEAEGEEGNSQRRREALPA